MSARSPPRCTRPPEDAGGGEALEVCARLTPTPPNDLRLADHEAATSQRVEIDAAGHDVAARVGRVYDDAALSRERIERLRLDQRQLMPCRARAPERAAPVE
jgi:hypothetical protein